MSHLIPLIPAVAKVARDLMVENWKFNEPSFEAVGGLDFGSGYPSDPKCKAWLVKNQSDPLFGYPDLVRFSWGPAKEALKESTIAADFEADEEDEDQDDKQQAQSMSAFLSTGSVQKKARLGYFQKRKLQRVPQILQT